VIVLGIDTSGYANAVGVIDGDKVLADAVFEARTNSLEQIVDNIDSTIKSAGLTLDDIAGIGAGLGPGSWTGIRVGVTVGKMLAFSTGKPVAGIPTLEALACAARDELLPVCAVIGVGAGDAVYAALYHPSGDRLSRIGDYYVGGVKGLTGVLTGPSVLVGTGARSYADLVTRESGIEVRAIEAVPEGPAVAWLAKGRLERGEGDDALSLTPLYLKESTAKAFVSKYGSSHS
jgi:tRNA threonylcarbamoyladenosine biosynthesis protein TsaB